MINILDTVMTTLQDSKESESFIIKDQGQRPPKQRLKWALMAIGVLVIIGAIIGIFHHFFTIEACPINESCQTNFQILKKLNITLDENEKENCLCTSVEKFLKKMECESDCNPFIDTEDEEKPRLLKGSTMFENHQKYLIFHKIEKWTIFWHF